MPVTPARHQMPVERETISALSRRLRAGDVTSEAITEACLDSVGAQNDRLNAFITVTATSAREQAREADREFAQGRHRGPLHGVPISLKDLLDVAGVPTTAASRVRSGHVASKDAPAVARLRATGAVFVGKCNLHEFAFGTTNDESAFGPARHPVDLLRSPGGSSGGSAVSVAAGMAYASVGTDTGGSVRIPAAACGLVGLKPSHDEISTAGIVPLSFTMDHVGPLCRSVEDAAFLYEALAGAQPGNASPPAAHVRLGVPSDYFLAVLDPEVASEFDRACTRLRAAGVVLEDVAIPHASTIAAVYLHIVLTEAAAYHANTLDGQPGDYTDGVRLRLELGRYVLAEDYVRAQRGREVLRGEVDRVLAGRDGLLLPSLAVPAPPIGATTIRIGSTEEPLRPLMLRLTQLFNLTGHPAITMPCGRTAAGLPLGIQVAGHTRATPALLRVARTIEPLVASAGLC
jgi:aspartyl-tRNA(Asn)/glutamyl-tRNA(Gln) amidotransferase subunit A